MGTSSISGVDSLARGVFGGQKTLTQVRGPLLQPAVESFRFARLPPGKRVGRNQRESDGRIHISNPRVGKLVRIHFPPTHGFARGGSGKSSRVRAGIGNLQEVIVPRVF